MFILMFVTLLSRILNAICGFHACVPNTQFLISGRLCYCNSIGQWSEASCQSIGRRQTCQPGQIIWEECSQCICQENGKLLCTNTQCTENSLRNKTELNTVQWCTPFKTYYKNCSLCICPASGKMSEARCATDFSCTLKGPLPMDVILKNVCIPKVMYIFTCLHCLCSEDGYFDKSKCVETCHHAPQSVKRCIPRTFYRTECNVCRCPDNGIRENSLCTKSICSPKSRGESLEILRNKTSRCDVNKFAKPRCFYCECSSHGVVNEHACLELECLKINDYNYGFVTNTYSPGEMVAICTECFCTPSGFTLNKFCTKVCTIQNKLQILEKIFKENLLLIDLNSLKVNTGNEICDPAAVFLDQGKYCLCPENGNANFKLCTSVVEEMGTPKPLKASKATPNAIDFNASCEPNTYVEFGCNSCYCTKDGKINLKWCTYDDCEAKRLIQEIHKTNALSLPSEASKNCGPGSIYKIDCNFCICGESGSTKDKACTKNVCNGEHKTTHSEFACEPSIYYTVDCNICFCPADGIKNLDKCTKNQCESNFLRTDTCVPGKLFCDDCNICVCPPNGDKKDKVCTNRTCEEADTPWKKIFKLSQSLLGNQIAEDTTRNLDMCFPGEEFEVGCKVCVCPEMGLREYATCTSMLCDENAQSTPSPTARVGEIDKSDLHPRSKRQLQSCQTYNLTDENEIHPCTPGSMYIIRCRQCICPYMGNINYFCRPLPYGFYCEQAYPNINYFQRIRRFGDNFTSVTTLGRLLTHDEEPIPHKHTFYSCEVAGKVEDSCFICQCEESRFIVEEHCFKSNLTICEKARPTFLRNENRIE